MKKLLFAVILLCFISNVYGVEGEIGSGISIFSFTDNSNTHSVRSFISGVKVSRELDPFELTAAIDIILPYNVSFTDSQNDFYFIGFSPEVGIGYQFLTFPWIESTISFLTTYNFIYFYDQTSDLSNEYLFSVLGNGLELDISFPLKCSYKLGVQGGYNLNYLAFHKIDGDFKWSDNIVFTISLSKGF